MRLRFVSFAALTLLGGPPPAPRAEGLLSAAASCPSHRGRPDALRLPDPLRLLLRGGHQAAPRQRRGLHKRPPRPLPERHGRGPRHDAHGGLAVGLRHRRQRLVPGRGKAKTSRASKTPRCTSWWAGAAGRAASSPHRLRVSTVGDELKLAGRNSRVIGIAVKDRSAILMAGRMADAPTGSAPHRPLRDQLLVPGCAACVGGGLPEPQGGRELVGARVAGGRSRREAGSTPGNATRGAGPGVLRDPVHEPVRERPDVEFATRPWRARPGHPEATDLLAVSFSCNDSVGHDKGPHSPEVEDVTRQTDRAIGRLLAAVDRQVGLARTLVVLTADQRCRART